MYVKRDAKGQIESISQRPGAGFDDELPADSPELKDFLGASEVSRALSESDLDMARVLEDLIDLLIDKQVIQFTELPEAAQKKLLSRASTRTRLREALDLLGDDGLIL